MEGSVQSTLEAAREIFSNFDTFGTLLAVAATVIAFAISSFSSIFAASRSRLKQGEPKEELKKFIAGDPNVDIETINFDDHTRLDELLELQLRFQRQARRNALSFNLLVFGQYIVGALLASSFVQNTLNQSIIGLLGVMVLLSAAIQQRFRPDVLATQARFRLVKCNRFMRGIEDGIFSIRTGAISAPSILALRAKGTQALNELESNELSGIESFYDIRRSADDQQQITSTSPSAASHSPHAVPVAQQ